MAGRISRAAVAAGVGVAMLSLISCGSSSSGTASGTIAVVAAENFWGSLAGQLGGTRVTVQSVVTDPNADPHEYESSTDDARAFADAGLVILNGAGYDDWGRKLVDANPSSGRRVLVAADVLSKKVGDNPHFWYSPAYVARVADAITAQYKALDPSHTRDFDLYRSALTDALQPYDAEVASIKQRFSGTPIASTESVFVYMAEALGLDLTTPVDFMNAVAEGNDPSAGAVITFENQIAGNQIKVLVFNTQTTTLVTTNIKAEAAAHHIPTVAISETMQPPNSTFQDWQLAQLQALEAALASRS